MPLPRKDPFILSEKSNVRPLHAEQDIISDFFQLTQDDWSPEIFRRWSAVSLVAAALERRVWIRTGKFITFPNLYTLLVAPPGTGKQIVAAVRDILEEVKIGNTKEKAFKIAPDSMTNAALIDTLVDSRQTRIGPGGAPYSYSSLFVGAEEFSVLMPTYDMGFVGTLNSVYNNPAIHREHRRHGRPPKLEIEYPVLNLLGGIQPAFMSSNFPEEVWTTGLSRRCIMAFSSEQKIRNPFDVTTPHDELRRRLISGLSRLSAVQGQITWGAGALKYFLDWHMGGGQPAPTHSKLIGYNTSRSMNLMKLSGISLMSRFGGFEIDEIDVKRGLNWLLETESAMPEIFRAMQGKNDWQILEELHRFMTAQAVRTKHKPMERSLVFRWISQWCTVEKTRQMFDLAMNSGVFLPVVGDVDHVTVNGNFVLKME